MNGLAQAVQNDPGAVDDWPLFSLIALLVFGVFVSPDKGRKRWWLYWVGAPVAVGMVHVSRTGSPREAIVLAGMGLTLLAVVYAIRRVLRAIPERFQWSLFLTVTLAPAAGLAVYLMVHAWQHRAYPTFVAVAMITGGFVVAASAPTVLRRVPVAQRWSVTSGPAGTVIRTNWLRVAVPIVASLVLLAGIILIGLLIMQRNFDYPFFGSFDRSDRKLLSQLVFAGMMAALLVPWTIVWWIWGPRRVRLTIGPEGVATNGSWRPATTRWADIERADPRLEPTSRNPRRMNFVLDTYPRIELALDNYPVGADALPTMVRFYWRYPELRAELVDGRAARRLLSGDRFDSGQEEGAPTA